MSTISTALSLLTRPVEKLTKPSKKDREWYLLSRRGWSEDMLASRDKKSPTTIKAGIMRYQLWRDSMAVDEQDLAIAEMTSRLMPKVEKVLTEAMTATHSTNVGRGNKVIMRKGADYATRIKAVETVKSLIETGRPKGGGIQINTQVNNPGGKGDGQAPGGTGGFDFESHLRDIRAKKGLGNDESVIDAEFETAEDGGLSAELAEIGVEIDPNDEDLEDEELEDEDVEDEG